MPMISFVSPRSDTSSVDTSTWFGNDTAFGFVTLGRRDKYFTVKHCQLPQFLVPSQRGLPQTLLLATHHHSAACHGHCCLQVVQEGGTAGAGTRSGREGTQKPTLQPRERSSSMTLRCPPVRRPRLDVSTKFCAPRFASHTASARPKPPRPPVMTYERSALHGVKGVLGRCTNG